MKQVCLPCQTSCRQLFASLTFRFCSLDLVMSLKSASPISSRHQSIQSQVKSSDEEPPVTCLMRRWRRYQGEESFTKTHRFMFLKPLEDLWKGIQCRPIQSTAPVVISKAQISPIRCARGCSSKNTQSKCMEGRADDIGADDLHPQRRMISMRITWVVSKD